MSRVLKDMGNEYRKESWLEASRRLDEGAAIISEATNVIVAYLTRENAHTDKLNCLFTKIMEIMTDVYIILKKH